MNLRKSAREAPHCFYCYTPNQNGDRLCLAHSNSLRDGRGFSHKSPDERGAIVCFLCHERIDGRSGGLSKDAKRDMHQEAHERTVIWWKQNGYLTINRKAKAA